MDPISINTQHSMLAQRKLNEQQAKTGEILGKVFSKVASVLASSIGSPAGGAVVDAASTGLQHALSKKTAIGVAQGLLDNTIKSQFKYGS